MSSPQIKKPSWLIYIFSKWNAFVTDHNAPVYSCATPKATLLWLFSSLRPAFPLPPAAPKTPNIESRGESAALSKERASTQTLSAACGLCLFSSGGRRWRFSQIHQHDNRNPKHMQKNDLWEPIVWENLLVAHSHVTDSSQPTWPPQEEVPVVRYI